jgi:hypothetical protein
MRMAFLIAVGGCLDFQSQMRYFHANVFRRSGYPLALLDIANKVFLIRTDLSNRIRSGSLPAPAAWRDLNRYEFDLDQAAVWRQVRQPVLAIYGENDRQVPVAESSTALAAALEQSGNRDFTLVIYPGASHAIGKTRTGELGEEWTGYVPEYLDDMADWVQQQASGSKRPEGGARRGQVPESGQPFTAGRYDRLRWYGNAPVQAIQFIAFALVFLAGALAGAVRLVRGRRRDPAAPVTAPGKWLTLVVTAVCVLNLALMAGLITLTLGLTNTWDPRYSPALSWLPLGGSLSLCLTLALLVLLLTRRRVAAYPPRRRIGRILLATCAIAFVPFLIYWNLVGLAWH